MDHLRAVIFDLDGVITDTAEYHYQAWKRLAEEEGVPFTRVDNEQLRGVCRRESLNLLLKGRPVTEEQANELMARKNHYYRALLQTVSQADLLPGVVNLLAEIRSAGLRIAIASASQNSPEVIRRLGIETQIDLLAHGGSVKQQKPAPDLFLFTAQQLGIPPEQCLVIEDAQAGVMAAQAAGMRVIGLGPVERVGAANRVLPDLACASLADIMNAYADC